MNIIFEPSGNLKEFSAILKKMENDEAIESLCIFSCDENNWSADEISPQLKTYSKPLFGGIFPEVIHHSKHYKKGTLVIGLPYQCHVATILGLDNEHIDYADDIDEKFDGINNFKTMFVYIDGLSKRVSSLVESLFDVFGVQNNYIGGGAGSLSFIQKPCIFTNHGLLQDCAILASIENESSVAVGHGWKTINKNYQLTKVDKNIILELDYKNAFDVYKSAVDKHSKQSITNDNFFEIAKAYPFGINILEGERIVRDPISVQNNTGMVCVGELKKGDYVDILNATGEELIEAARITANKAQKAFDKINKQSKLSFFIDCISRSLFLEDDFEKEIKAVKSEIGEELPLVGALVLGEIANTGKNYLEFYNKTSVVAIL